MAAAFVPAAAGGNARLFSRDATESERNYFKANCTILETSLGKRRTSLIAFIVNIPSALLLQGRERECVSTFMRILREKTGFSFGQGNSAVVHDRTFALECSYVLG